jgi:hypothetical protein
MDINDLDETQDDFYPNEGISLDLDSYLDCLVRDVDERIARERMRWPNPNPTEELEDIWRHYEAAWARAVFNPQTPTDSGLGPADELAYWWQRYQQAVIEEGGEAWD